LNFIVLIGRSPLLQALQLLNDRVLKLFVFFIYFGIRDIGQKFKNLLKFGNQCGLTVGVSGLGSFDETAPLVVVFDFVEDNFGRIEFIKLFKEVSRHQQ
jgi:hypothetical protein